MRRSRLPAVFVFILPPSYDALAARLSLRATESAATLARRLQDATREAPLYTEFDYVVVNDELGTAAADLIAIVRAARRRRERCGAEAAGIVATFPPAEAR